MARLILVLTLLALATEPGVAGAQSLQRAHRGQEVRIEQQPGRRVTGTLVGVNDSTVIVERAGVRREVQRDRMTAAFVSSGRNRGKGASTGLIYGVISGLALSAVALSAGDCSNCMEIIDDGAVVAGLTGIGAIVGTVIGILAAPTRWMPASIGDVSVSPVSVPQGGVGARVTLRF